MLVWARQHRVAILCVCYALIMDALDIATTLMCKGNPMVEEKNAFMRDAAHRFLLSHALGAKGLAFILLLAFAFLVYELVKPLSEKVAESMFGILFLASGVNLSNTIFQNFLYGLGWWKP